MNQFQKQYYDKRAQVLLKNLHKRHFDAYYCENREQALEEALSQLKKESGYLFESSQAPKFARFTGVKETVPAAPATLAGALRERMRK